MSKKSDKTLITSRDPKGQQTLRLLGAAYDKLGLTEDQAQRLNERGGELVSGVKKLITGLVVSDHFKDEEIASDRIYPEDYQLLPIKEQVTELQRHFPMLNGANLEIVDGELPEWADGWGAIPRWDKVGKTYNEAVVERALPLLDKSRKLYNYMKGKLSEKHLRQNQRTIEMWQTLCDQQEGNDIIIVPIQFGMRHRGRSVRRARECFRADEFGLGIFATVCLLLVHPKRLQRWEQLHWDCAGDDYDWHAAGGWTRCPSLYFYDDEVKLNAYGVGHVLRYFGPASGFLPPVQQVDPKDTAA